MQFDQSTDLFTCAYECSIRFSFRDDRIVEAKGQATRASKDKSNAVEFAKKNAVSDAKKKAFQLLALVLLPNGKVAVYINSPKKEEPQSNAMEQQQV